MTPANGLRRTPREDWPTLLASLAARGDGTGCRDVWLDATPAQLSRTDVFIRAWSGRSFFSSFIVSRPEDCYFTSRKNLTGSGPNAFVKGEVAVGMSSYGPRTLVDVSKV
jgi:hypothetical protein